MHFLDLRGHRRLLNLFTDNNCLASVPCKRVNGFLVLTGGLSEDFQKDYAAPTMKDMAKRA